MPLGEEMTNKCFFELKVSSIFAEKKREELFQEIERMKAELWTKEDATLSEDEKCATESCAFSSCCWSS